MQTASVNPIVRRAHVGDHVCQPYGTDDEFLQCLVDLSSDGLVRRHKVLIFTELLPALQVTEHLAQRIPGLGAGHTAPTGPSPILRRGLLARRGIPTRTPAR
jgi:hypothetical protein